MEINLQELQKMNATEYKRIHESFMQNNHGSTLLHTFSAIFFTVQCSLFCSISNRCERFQYFSEYTFIILPLIMAHTVFSDHVCLLNVIISWFLCYEIKQHWPKLDIVNSFSKPNRFINNKISSISCLRGLTYLITVFCILAVDFQVFPRYLAKTENYGYSLMDTGVGLFVLMSGLVHKDLNTHNFKEIVKGNVKFISILVFLGFGRFWSVKQLEYQEHVTEYGVHWNFFFTLAACKLTSTLLLFYSNRALLFSVATLVLHEFMLQYGLQKWVFSEEPRNTLLNANREGISSCLGYTSMYLFAAYLKTELNNKSVPRYKLLYRLLFGSIFLWISSSLVNVYLPTSRTLANTGYCLYLETILVTVMVIMFVFEVLYQDREKGVHFEIPVTLNAINKNGLLYFLIANLLTGAINLTFRTLLLSSDITFVILNLYMIVTIVITLYLFKKGYKI